MTNLYALMYCLDCFDHESGVSPIAYTPDGNSHWVERTIQGGLVLCSDGPFPFYEDQGSYTKTRKALKKKG